MITIERLAAELRRRKRADFSIVERAVRRGTVRRDRSLARLDDETRLALAVHLDTGRGRGTGELELAGDRGDDAAAIVDAAEARALANLGPAWETPAQAAPARVELEDPAFAEIDDGTAHDALATLPADADATASVERVVVRLVTGGVSGRDLAVRWVETRVAVRAILAAAGHTGELVADARRIADLRLPERVRLLLEDLAARDAARSPPPGIHDVVLRAPAHAHGGYGLWWAIVAQADAALVRQGLSRYRVGEPIAPHAEAGGEPLEVVSDGTLPFGVRSAPCGDRGEPVRRFVVIERGRARGLAYDQREAALARREPNGGIRNLVVNGGASATADLLAAGPVIEVRRLAWLDLDPRSGYAVARIAAGVLHDAGGGHAPLGGGTLRFDAIAALAAARRSSETVVEGPVAGPAALRISGVTVTGW